MTGVRPHPPAVFQIRGIGGVAITLELHFHVDLTQILRLTLKPK
jgi:hypothetical protein